MDQASKPFVQVVIDDVDAVIHDPEGVYDADLYDRYATFEQARDAALCCLEYALEEGAYEGEPLGARLESMHRLLEAASSIEDLAGREEYRRLLGRLAPALPAAA